MQVTLNDPVGDTIVLTPLTPNKANARIPMVFNSQTYTCPFYVSGESSKSKGGVVRTMVKTGIEIPVSGETADVGVSEEITLHSVLTVGPKTQGLLHGTAAQRTSAINAIRMLMKSQQALIGDDDGFAVIYPGNTDLMPLIRGTDGMIPFDVVNGVYKRAEQP